MSSSMKWNGEAFLQRTEAEQERRMQLAVRHVANRVKIKISTKGPPHSKRGDAPHLITGQLRRSIAVEVVRSTHGVVGRVGTNIKYAKYLELDQYLGRPFLASTLKEEGRMLDHIFNKMA